MESTLTDLLLGMVFSGTGMAITLPVVWLSFSETVTLNIRGFSAINFLVVLGVLFVYFTAADISSVASFIICIIVAFFFHLGRVTEFLEREDKRFRILFLSMGYTKNEYVTTYLFRKSLYRNVASFLMGWGLFSFSLTLSRITVHFEFERIFGGVLLILLGLTSALLERKN